MPFLPKKPDYSSWRSLSPKQVAKRFFMLTFMPHWKLEVGSQRSNLKLTNVSSLQLQASSLQKGTKPNENRGQKPNELSLYLGI
jgi:hypothetical protein